MLGLSESAGVCACVFVVVGMGVDVNGCVCVCFFGREFKPLWTVRGKRFFKLLNIFKKSRVHFEHSSCRMH